MASDAVVLSLAKLDFTWPTARTLRGYLVGVALDNFGTVQVVEPPSSTLIKHRPLLDRPFSWPLAFDGFTLYQRTGGLPDFVSFSLLIVRDRAAARRAGDVLKSIGDSDDFKQLLAKASSLAATSGGTASAVTTAVSDIARPLMDLIGKQLAQAQDKLLDTIDGSLHFDPVTKAKSELDSTVPGAIAKATFDFHLFDAAADGESKTGLESSVADLRARGLLIGSQTGGATGA